MCTFTKGVQVGLVLIAVLVELHHLPPDILWRPNVIVTILTAVPSYGLQCLPMPYSLVPHYCTFTARFTISVGKW